MSGLQIHFAELLLKALASLSHIASSNFWHLTENSRSVAWKA